MTTTTTTTTGRTRTPPPPLDFHPDTPDYLREAAEGVNEVLWVFEWVEEEGVSLAEFWIDTDTPQPRLGLTRYVRDTDNPENPELNPLNVHVDVTTEHPVQQVRELIHSHLAHEADEQMRLNGVQIFDPHLHDGDIRPQWHREQVEAEREKWDL